MSEKKIPMRMCIACKEIKPKKDMLRIVKSEQGIFLDLTGKANGRGAYICDNEECLKKLKKQKVLNKVFSCEVSEEVYDKISEIYSGGKK